jgi:hypothetical protein
MGQHPRKYLRSKSSADSISNLFPQLKNGAVVQYLQEVDIVVVSDPDCKETHTENICAGVLEGDNGQCNVNMIKNMFFHTPIIGNVGIVE